MINEHSTGIVLHQGHYNIHKQKKKNKIKFGDPVFSGPDIIDRFGDRNESRDIILLLASLLYFKHVQRRRINCNSVLRRIQYTSKT